jgi:hypothetical protein
LFTSEEAAEVWVWVQAGSGIAYSVFLVALAPMFCCGSASARVLIRTSDARPNL